MNRWWTATALLSSPIILGLEASPAAAQSQYAISIIMTTLGTDGTPVTTAMDLPPGSSVTVKTGPADMACPNMPVPDTNAGSTPGSGGGGGGGSGGGTITPTSNNTTPSGATGNPAAGGGEEPPTPPATPETPTDEPTVPAPPVVLPPTTTDPGTPEPDPTIPNVPEENGGEPTTVPVPTSPPGPNETPEPATLTLAALGILGAAGYSRRRKS